MGYFDPNFPLLGGVEKSDHARNEIISTLADITPHLKPQVDTEGAAFGLETIATSYVSASPLSRFWV